MENQKRMMNKFGDYEYGIDGSLNPCKGVEFVGMHLGERTKWTHPYSYDPLLQFRKYSTTPDTARAVYSDRMCQWDYDKYRKLCKEHFNDNGGDYFNSRSAKDIESFLREYFGKPELELVRVEEQCNVSNGYPVWAFWFITAESIEESKRYRTPPAKKRTPKKQFKTARARPRHSSRRLAKSAQKHL